MPLLIFPLVCLLFQLLFSCLQGSVEEYKTSSVFDRIPFKPSLRFNSETDLLFTSLNVRAYNHVVQSEKDKSLEEISPEEFRKTTKHEEEEEEEEEDFQLIFDDQKMEYILKQPTTTTTTEVPSTKHQRSSDWMDSKENIEMGHNQQVEELLNGGEAQEKLDEQTEQLEFDQEYYNQSSFLGAQKSLATSRIVSSMDTLYLEKEEFSVRVPAEELEKWKSTLSNVSLLEHRSANEHRDYGSSYILPVLKSVEYDNTSVPLAFNDIPVNVVVALNFLYLANFDSELMEYSMDVEMEFSWFDVRLVNNYTKPIRIREKAIIDSIWKPDPYIVNSKYSYFHAVSFPNIRMRITPQGLVTYTMRVTSVCSCFMSFCLYPHDRQECDLRISSIAYSNKYLKFNWHSIPIKFQSKISLPELHITKMKTDECHIDGKMVDSSCLRIIFSLERDSARFVIEKYVPSTLAMMFAWVAPYVPYNYEDVRIITPITVLLTLVQMEKGDKEIRTSYLTSIDIWFAAMKSFTVLSLLESLAVLALIKRSRAMIKNAERAANEFERCTFEAEAYRLNRLYHRLDSICRFSSPIVFIMFFVYYVLFITQGNSKCADG